MEFTPLYLSFLGSLYMVSCIVGLFVNWFDKTINLLRKISWFIKKHLEMTNILLVFINKM